MSVTRYIKANTATQVNSNLIGVQVRPDTGSISMDYIWNTVSSTTDTIAHFTLVLQDGEGGNKFAYKNYEGGLFPEPGYIIDVPDGQGGTTRYYRHNKYGVAPEDYLYSTLQEVTSVHIGAEFVTITSEVIEEETVYTVTRWGEVTGVFDGPGSAGNTFEIYDGEWLVLDDVNLYNIFNDSVQDYYRFDTSNGFIYDDNNNIFGFAPDGVVGVSGVELTADLQAESDWEGKYKWTGTPVLNGSPASQYYTDVPVYTDDIDPEIGATVYYTKDNPDYNQMTVSGKDPGAVSCSVEFSVTGDAFSKVDDNLTDANNVIANVPKYVYLRFGQDVEITEE